MEVWRFVTLWCFVTSARRAILTLFGYFSVLLILKYAQAQFVPRPPSYPQPTSCIQAAIVF